MKSSAQDTPDASQEASRYSLPAKPNSKMNTAGAQRQRAPPCYDQRSEAPAERSWLIQDDRPATSNQSQPVAQALAAPSAGSLAWSQHACSGHSASTTACYLFHLCRSSRYLDVPCGTSGSILIEIRLKSFLPLPWLNRLTTIRPHLCPVSSPNRLRRKILGLYGGNGFYGLRTGLPAKISAGPFLSRVPQDDVSPVHMPAPLPTQKPF